ncbi:MAG: hypothetical protein GEU26_05455 [Nitrososphaeraceae archaeon]|nr:hypothetical protein [Nitrososphaeraceae archaeon]
MFLAGALSVLSRILITSKDDPGSEDVPRKARQQYKSKLEEILASTDESSEHHKSISKQILEYLANPDERFQIYWNSWKKCMREVKEDHRFEQYTRYFINDLIYASKENRESILPELYTLIDSTEEYISSRAKGLHDDMFS